MDKKIKKIKLNESILKGGQGEALGEFLKDNYKNRRKNKVFPDLNYCKWGDFYSKLSGLMSIFQEGGTVFSRNILILSK